MSANRSVRAELRGNLVRIDWAAANGSTGHFIMTLEEAAELAAEIRGLIP